MSNNPILKRRPEEFFDGGELLVAKAVRENNPGLIGQIIKQNPLVNLNKAGSDGVTLLLWACAHQNPRTVEKLLELGANPNQEIVSESGSSHLVAMCASGINDEIFKILLDYGGNPNGEVDGTPALFKTVYARRLDRMKLLLAKGADINSIDKQTSKSLVHFCSVLNQFEIVYYLIEMGADYSQKDAVGGSVPLQVQEMKGQLNDETEFWRKKVEDLLIQKGVIFPVKKPWQ